MHESCGKFADLLLEAVHFQLADRALLAKAGELNRQVTLQPQHFQIQELLDLLKASVNQMASGKKKKNRV